MYSKPIIAAFLGFVTQTGAISLSRQHRHLRSYPGVRFELVNIGNENRFIGTAADPDLVLEVIPELKDQMPIYLDARPS